MDQKQLKLLGYLVLAILILNLLLFAFRIITSLVFWLGIILGALFVWKVLPWLKNKN